MPHFTIEYSANLESKVEIGGLCDHVLVAALKTGMFETGAVRVRAIRCDHYAIADQARENSFIDVSLRLASGRDLALRQSAGAAIFAEMSAFLAPLFEDQHFALSFELREINPLLSFKKNSIHERLRPR